MTMIDKYPMSLPAAMKNVVYDLETNSKAYKMLLNKTDQMAQNFNFIQELEKNLEENGDLQRKKAKVFSLTRTESSPNFLFTNKSPENLSNITNEISIIKNSIVEQDRRRTLAKSRVNQPFSRNESSLQESNTMNKLTHRTNTLTKIFTRDGELPLLHKRTETFTKSGKGRKKKGIQINTIAPGSHDTKWITINQNEVKATPTTSRNFSNIKYETDTVENTDAYQHFMMKAKVIKRANKGFKSAREMVGRINNDALRSSFLSTPVKMEHPTDILSPMFSEGSIESQKPSPPEVVTNIPFENGPMLQSRRL